MIGERSQFAVNGLITDGQIAAGDCFEITRAQPYIASKASYETDTGNTDFWVPFPQKSPTEKAADGSPADMAYTLDAQSNPPSTVEWMSDYKLKVTVTA